MQPPEACSAGGPGEGSGGDGGASSWKVCVYFARGYCKHGAACRFSHPHSQGPGATHSAHSHSQGPGGTHSAHSLGGAVTGSCSGQGSGRGGLSPASSGEAVEAGEALPGVGSARGSPLADSAWLPLLQAELQDLLHAHGAPVPLASLPHLYSDKYGKALDAEGPPRDSQQGAGPSAGPSTTRGSPAAVLRLVLRLKSALTVFERSDGQKAVALKRCSPPKGVEGEASGGMDSPSSRQIYLTFPAESSFSEEDVALHFGLFGTVHDVRIPHQQKRMFGFVTFAGPEPVRAILKHGNPHFICGSRVLVKPYRERAKPADRYKHTEGGKGAAGEQFKHARGPLESKIPPRHLNARMEGKAGPGLASGPRAGTSQGWPPLHPPQMRSAAPGRDSGADSSEASHLPGLAAPQGGHGAPAQEAQGAPEFLLPGQFSQAPLDPHSDVAHPSTKSPPTHVAPATPHPELWAETQEAEAWLEPREAEPSPWPRARLFQDSDSTQGAGGVQYEDSLATGSSAPNAEDDLGIDLDSLLPESPFSSPKRGKGAAKQGSPLTAPGPGASVLRSSAGEWQPSSLPAGAAPPVPMYWGFADTAPYPQPPTAHWAGEQWAGKDTGQEQGPYAMMPHGAGLHELTHGMAYLAVAPSPPHTNTLEAPPVDASSLAKRTTLLCASCRAQPVGIPNSQCTYCLQLACHSYTHEAHLYQDVTPNWHVPVNTYIRASHNSSC